MLILGSFDTDGMHSKEKWKLLLAAFPLLRLSLTMSSFERITAVEIFRVTALRAGPVRTHGRVRNNGTETMKSGIIGQFPGVNRPIIFTTAVNFFN